MAELADKEALLSVEEFDKRWGRLDRLEREGRVADLEKELQSPDRYRALTLRGSAARALGHLRARRSAAEIVKLLGDSDRGVRERAIVALGRIGESDDGISQRLLEVAHRDPTENTRALAIGTLGQLEDPELVPLLESLLSSPSRLIRDAAFYSALMIGTPEAEAAVASQSHGWRGRRKRRRAGRVVEKFRQEYR
jgi:HEAT repeat protein